MAPASPFILSVQSTTLQSFQCMASRKACAPEDDGLENIEECWLVLRQPFKVASAGSSE